MLSEKIRLLRVKKGLSQEELAAEIEVSRQTVSKWESGVCLPDTEKLLRLCQYFGCTSDFFLTDWEETKKASDTYRKKKRVPWLFVLIAAEIISIVFIVYCSQFITSQKEITQKVEVANEYEGETFLEVDTSTFDTTELLPFLKTYHLEIVFILLCADLGVNLVIITKRKMRKKRM